MTTTTETTIIAGTRPVGNCTPDGTHRWATRRFEDGVWYFTSYDGWLISSETSTSDPELARIIASALEAK